MQRNVDRQPCMAFVLGIYGRLVHMLARFRARGYTYVLGAAARTQNAHEGFDNKAA